MNTTTAPAPASLTRAEPETGDLDARIQQAERRLVAREEDLRRRADSLVRRVREAWRPRRLLAPVAGAAMAIGVLWWLLRGRGRAQPFSSAGPAAPGPGTSHPMPWVSWIGFAWPLLPAAWRARISPATATTIITLGLPLAEKLLARRKAPPLQTVPEVDLARFAGGWYVVGRLPPDDGASGQPVQHWTLRDDGQLDLRVSALGSAHDAHGVARATPGGHGARLGVSFWPAALRALPLAWHDRWVLHLDDDYREAVLGTPDRGGLWLLSRTPRLPRERLRGLLQVALERGFDIEALQFFGPR